MVNEIIKNLKMQLKDDGFVNIRNIYYKKTDGKIVFVNFHKRLDGECNIELGIQFEINIDDVKIKNADIGCLFKGDITNFVQEVNVWFNERATMDKIRKLFWSGKLGDFISDKCEKIIKKEEY